MDVDVDVDVDVGIAAVCVRLRVLLVCVSEGATWLCCVMRRMVWLKRAEFHANERSAGAAVMGREEDDDMTREARTE